MPVAASLTFVRISRKSSVEQMVLNFSISYTCFADTGSSVLPSILLNLNLDHNLTGILDQSDR